MFLKFFPAIFLYINIVLFSLSQIYAQEKEGEIIIISERVGEVIDSEEREKFILFNSVAGFQSAVYFKTDDSRYFLKITYQDEETGELKVRLVQQAEASIKIRGYYIDNFEELQSQKDKEKMDAQEKKPTQKFEEPNILPGNNINDSEKIQKSTFVYSNPGLSFFFELLGKHFFSFNLDYRINKSHALGVGYSEITFDGDDRTRFPGIMYYNFGGDKFQRELGIGISLTLSEKHGHVHTLINGVLGRRYQKKNGLLIRYGFTPLIRIGVGKYSGTTNIPSVGLSLGFSL